MIRRLADPNTRADLLKRYTALHVPVDAALSDELGNIPHLAFEQRSRAHLLRRFAGPDPLPAFPHPHSRAEALGMLYVLEGSTLGGRLILRTLAAKGVSDPDLAFLDPYGSESGARWREFLAVLENETGGDAGRIGDAEKGAVRGFEHAEAVLCGEEP